jgi:membrane-associated phospholipid phosphatase
MGWMLLPIMVLLPKTGKAQVIFKVIIVSWGIFVGLGRIVIGAHYGSDVLFSTGMAVLVSVFSVNYWKEEYHSNKNESEKLSS